MKIGEALQSRLLRAAVELEALSPEQRLSGDLDEDGVISAADARLALRAAVGLELYAADSRAFKAADVNLDTVITSADARLILRKAVGFNDAEFGLKS